MSSPCAAGMACTNLEGSYVCECPPGYYADDKNNCPGRICQIIRINLARIKRINPQTSTSARRTTAAATSSATTLKAATRARATRRRAGSTTTRVARSFQSSRPTWPSTARASSAAACRRPRRPLMNHSCACIYLSVCRSIHLSIYLYVSLSTCL